MRDQKLDVFRREAVLVEKIPAGFVHLPNRILEDLLAVLFHKVLPCGDRLRRGRHAASPARLLQVIAARSVDFIQKPEKALAVFGRLNDHRARAVAEQHARAAIRVIDDARHRIGADHHHLFMRPALDQVRGCSQAINETGARCHQVESPRALRP